MKQFDVFEATIEGDMGGTSRVGFFTDEQVARAAVKGKSAWGGDGSVRPMTIVIYETAAEYTNESHASARRRALSKLSDEDKEALGL